MAKKDLSTEGALLGCLLLMISIPFSALFSGWTCHVLWGWFITHAWDIPSPGIAVCLGLQLLLHLLVGVKIDSDEYKDDSALGALIVIGLKPYLVAGFVLFVGWIVHFFV